MLNSKNSLRQILKDNIKRSLAPVGFFFVVVCKVTTHF